VAGHNPLALPSVSRWLVAAVGLVAMAALGIGTSLFAIARRDATVSSPEARSAIAAEVAEQLQEDLGAQQPPSIRVRAHQEGIDLICPNGPVADGHIDSPRGARFDLDDVIETGKLAELVVKMLHEKGPTYPWRCEIRHGHRCVVRAHYDTLTHKAVFDSTDPE
jgi:hypothetical protein